MTASENFAGWAVESVTWTTDGVLLEISQLDDSASETLLFGSKYARD